MKPWATIGNITVADVQHSRATDLAQYAREYKDFNERQVRVQTLRALAEILEELRDEFE